MGGLHKTILKIGKFHPAKRSKLNWLLNKYETEKFGLKLTLTSWIYRSALWPIQASNVRFFYNFL